MTRRTILLSSLDRAKLAAVLVKFARVSTAYVRRELARTLARAQLCAPTEVPPWLTTMNSRVLLFADQWKMPRECRLVYPDSESALEQQISILSPFGVALLGAREGSVFRVWDGRSSIKVLLAAVTYQPEAAKVWHL